MIWDKKCVQILIGELKGKRKLGIPRRKLEDNIKMDPRKMG
jgi:hypothetical protein